jgi:fucose 4-O-acetylase-like acetyltransferase
MDTIEIKKKIDYRIVRMRAFAILVVMFGHSIILYNSSWNLYSTDVVSPLLDVTKDIINTFQMPLFLAISGYCFYLSLSKKNMWNFDGIFKGLKNKFSHLILPFFLIALFYMIPMRMFCHYANWKGMNYFQIVLQVILGKDSGHLWFLPTLFYIFVFSYFVLSKVKDIRMDVFICTGALLLMLASSKVPVILFVNYFASSLYWFLLGFFINKYIISKYTLTVRGHIFYLLFAVCCVFLLCVVLFVKNPYMHLLLEKTVISILLFLSFVIIPNEKCNSATKQISDLSMGMYLLHSPLIYITFATIPNAAPIYVTCLNFVVFGIVSIIFSYVIKKSKIRMLMGD